jgi:7-cyano-7-deazaguanine synthase
MTDDKREHKARAVVLLSGGMDSAVTLAMALRQGFEVHALTFRYGQRHAVEIDAAVAIAAALGAAEHVVIDLDLARFGGSALTTGDPISTGEGEGEGKGERGGRPEIPATYVPARNAVFLALAASFAEALGARDVFIGVSAVDYSGYPDCRPEFIRAFETALNLGTRAGAFNAPLRLHAPLQAMSKADTVRTGIGLGVDFGLTRTCYDPGDRGAPCGACDACRLRALGFNGAGVADPIAAPRES